MAGFIVFGRVDGQFEDGGKVRDWGLWQIGIDGKHLRRLTKGFGTRGGSQNPCGLAGWQVGRVSRLLPTVRQTVLC